MKQKFKAEYDLESDILYIHSENVKTKESIEIEEDITLDIGSNKKLAGIEINYAYDFFKASNKNFDKKLLEGIKDIEIDLYRYRNLIIIKLLFKYDNKIIEEKLPALSTSLYKSPFLAEMSI
jgi:uncharacterized protein YuzE